VCSALLSLDQQFYIDHHLFVHLRHEVVMLDGQAITLTPMQYRLLALFVERAGEVVPKATILTQLWGAQLKTHKRLLAFHMRELRRKLGATSTSKRSLGPDTGSDRRQGLKAMRSAARRVSLPTTTKGPIMAEVHTTFRAAARTTSSYGLLSGSGSIRREVGLAAPRNLGG